MLHNSQLFSLKFSRAMAPKKIMSKTGSKSKSSEQAKARAAQRKAPPQRSREEVKVRTHRGLTPKLLPYILSSSITTLGELPIHLKQSLLSFINPVRWNALRTCQLLLPELDEQMSVCFGTPTWQQYKLPSLLVETLFMQCYLEHCRITQDPPTGPPGVNSFGSFSSGLHLSSG